MPVTTERLPQSLIALKFEVEDERLEATMGKAARRVAEQIKIPGFRPGKAPREVVERTVGKPALIQEALDLLLPDLYKEVVESEKIDAIAQPQFEIESMEPLVVSAQVPVRPTVDLNEYQSLRVPRTEPETSDDDVEESITILRRRYATLEPADRAVAWGDTVRADVSVSVEGQDEEPHEEQDAEFRVAEDSVVSLPGFLDHLIGLERGGPYDISFALPEDFDAAEMAGKTASYTVTIHEVKQEVLPDLDDEFVASLDDEEVSNVDELRERVQQDVQKRLEVESTSAYQEEILDVLTASAELDYPTVLVEHEIDRLVDQQSNHASHTQEELDRWLQTIGKTEQEVRDELRDAGENGVKRALVLGEVVSKEKLEITESSIDEEIDRLASQMIGGGMMDGGSEDDDQRKAVRAIFDTPDARVSLRDQLTSKAALDALVEICSQPEEEEAADRPRGSRRRRGRTVDGAADERAADGAEAAEDDANTGNSGDADNDEAGDAEIDN